MGTDVGTLNASLTLDLSGFREGMTEAAALAGELSAQLQSIFTGDGFMGMAADVVDLIQQIEILRGSVESFAASLQSMSGADVFAQMRTHTAALPGEISQISSAIASIDFTQVNIQLDNMRTTISALVGQLQQLTNIDLNTGELLGDGEEELSAFYYLQTNIQAINETLGQTPALLQECGVAALDWLSSMEQISGHTDNIVAQLRASAQMLRANRAQATGTRREAGGANREVQRIAKNLQTSKGYAVSLKGILGGIVISQSFYQLLNAMEELVNGAAKFSTSMQDAGVAFSYLMQDSTVSSEAFLNALKDIALRSPLDTTDLTAASRKLMAMGFSAEATVPALQILTDTAAVFSNSAGDMSNQIDHIALAFGQMIASGKVSAQELRQLYNAGLPIYELLSDGLGITMEQAKNIGKLGVDSATAVYAVLEQLQQRYGGAAEALTKTFSGSMAVIKESMQQLISYSWSGIFDSLTQKVSQLAQYLQALVKITQAYGPGGLFQAIFPEAGWDVLRRFIAGLQQIGAAIKNFFAIVGTYFGGGIQLLVQLGSYVLPILGNIANIITAVARAALRASPALRFLLSVLAAFVIGGVVYTIIARVVKVIWALTGAAKAAAAVKMLISGFLGLSAAGKAAIIGLLAIAAAFLAIVVASEKARAAISGFFKGIGAKVNGFAESLGLGYDLDSIEMPEFTAPDTSDFSDGLQDLIGGMEDLGDATEDAGKKAKKTTQSFDEVFTITEDSGSGSDAIADLISELEGIGNLNYGDLFDWTGDWATDWGNLSSGLGGLSDMGDAAGTLFDEIGEKISNFWESLTGSDYNAGLVALAALSDALIIIGKLKWGGALKVVEGIAEIATAINDISENGVNSDNALDAIHGISNVLLGISLLIGNFKITGWSLILQGFTEIIRELADCWDAIKEGDWSDVSKATLIIGGLKILGGLVLALDVFGKLKGVAKAGGAADAVTTLTAVSQTTETVTQTTGKLTTKLTDLAVNLGLGLIIIAEVAAAVLLVVGAAILLGKELEQVGIAWQPVIDNSETIESALRASVVLFVGMGAALALLGSAGKELAINMAIGLAVLVEISIATDLFVSEIWVLGELLNKVGEAWQPVRDNGDAIAQDILIGTALLVGIGAAAALLGVATVASAGALPLAIGLGTAILLELGAAAILFTTELTKVADELSGRLAPALTRLNTKLPKLTDDMNDFVSFMADFATAVAEYTKSTGSLTWSSIVDGFLSIFAGDPLGDLVDSIEDAYDELVRLNAKLAPAVTELETAVELLTDYGLFMSTLQILTSSGSAYTLSSDMFTNLRTVGNNLVTGLVKGISEEQPKAKKQMKSLGEDVITGLTDGMLKGMSTMPSWISTNIVKPIKNTLSTGLAATQFNAYGRNIIEGIKRGISNAEFSLYSQVTTLCNNIKQSITSSLAIHSPSRVTMGYGENIVEGMIKGITNLRTELGETVTDMMDTVKTGMETADAAIAPEVTLDDASNSALIRLNTWSTTFVTTIADTFAMVANLFDNLTERIQNATDNLANINSSSINRASAALNSSMGTLVADGPYANTTTTGTLSNQIMADLTETTLDRLSERVATRAYEYFAPLFATLNSDEQNRVMAYVGTLIADDAGLRELERKLKVIQVSERRRS